MPRQTGSAQFGLPRLGSRLWGQYGQQEQVGTVPIEFVGNEFNEQRNLIPMFDADGQEEVLIDGLNSILFAAAKTGAGGTISVRAPDSRIISGLLLQDVTYAVPAGISVVAIENAYAHPDGFIHATCSNVRLMLIRPPFCR